VNEHSTIRSLLLASLEHQLDADHVREVEHHLQSCTSCRRYFEAFAVVLEPKKEIPQPVLMPDPYLPTRIAALSRGGTAGERGHRVLNWALRTAAFALAVAFGIVIGESLATRTVNVTEHKIITEYSDSFNVGGIGDRLQTIAQATGEVSQ